MARAGLNCTLSWSDGRAKRSFRVRCSQLTEGFIQMGTESQARVTRAFYPHKVAEDRFSITVDLIGRRERSAFNKYLMGYLNYLLNPARSGKAIQVMTVSLPDRGFRRTGVPIQGIEYGARTGEFLWQPTVVFESLGTKDSIVGIAGMSEVRDYLSTPLDPETQYFYPTGVQLSGSQTPVSSVSSANAAEYSLGADRSAEMNQDLEP